MRKIEEKNKQFLIEKIIHGVEFKNRYNIETEKKPEIIETVAGSLEECTSSYTLIFLSYLLNLSGLLAP